MQPEANSDFDRMLGDLDYDFVTGQDLPETVEKRQDLAESKVVEDGQKLKDLSQHPGWLLIKTVMQETIDKEMQSLLHCRHIDIITMTQATIKARRELLSWLDIKMLEAKTLLEEQHNVASQP